MGKLTYRDYLLSDENIYHAIYSMESYVFDYNLLDIGDKIRYHRLKDKFSEKCEYSCAMKSHFRKFGNQMSGSGNHLCNYASLLA